MTSKIGRIHTKARLSSTFSVWYDCPQTLETIKSWNANPALRGEDRSYSEPDYTNLLGLGTILFNIPGVTSVHIYQYEVRIEIAELHDMAEVTHEAEAQLKLWLRCGQQDETTSIEYIEHKYEKEEEPIE